MTNREEGEILKGRNRYIHFVARRRRRRLVKGTNDGRYAWPIHHSLLSLDWRRRRLMRDEAPSKLRFIGAIRWSSSVTSCNPMKIWLGWKVSRERERESVMEIHRSRIHIKDVPLLAKVNRFFLESSETSEFVRRNKSIEQWPKETWRHRYPLLLLSNYRHFIRSWIRVYSSNYSQTGCDACGLAFFPFNVLSTLPPFLPRFLLSCSNRSTLWRQQRPARFCNKS